MAILVWCCLALMLGSVTGKAEQTAHLRNWMKSTEFGVPGVDFPDYTTLPQTNFSCSNYGNASGFYADVEARCQVFHVCHEGRTSSFLCPVRTLFNQELLTCDSWYIVTCLNSPPPYSSPTVVFPQSTERDTLSASQRPGRVLDQTSYDHSGHGDFKKTSQPETRFITQFPVKEEDLVETQSFVSDHIPESASHTNSFKTPQKPNIQRFPSSDNSPQPETTDVPGTVTPSAKLPETISYRQGTLAVQSMVTDSILTESVSRSLTTKQPDAITGSNGKGHSTDVSNSVIIANSILVKSKILRVHDRLHPNGSATTTVGVPTATSNDSFVDISSPHAEISSHGRKETVVLEQLPGESSTPDAVTEPLPSAKLLVDTKKATSEQIVDRLSTVHLATETVQGQTNLAETSEQKLVTRDIDSASTLKPYYGEITATAGPTPRQPPHNAETVAIDVVEVKSTTSPDATLHTNTPNDLQTKAPVATKSMKARTKLNLVRNDKIKVQQLPDSESPSSSVGKRRLRKYRLQSTDRKPQLSTTTAAATQLALIVPGVRQRGKQSKFPVTSQNSVFEKLPFAQVLQSTELPKTSASSSRRLRFKTRLPRQSGAEL